MIASDTRIDTPSGSWGGRGAARRSAQHKTARWDGALEMRDVLAPKAASLGSAVRIRS